MFQVGFQPTKKVHKVNKYWKFFLTILPVQDLGLRSSSYERLLHLFHTVSQLLQIAQQLPPVLRINALDKLLVKA